MANSLSCDALRALRDVLPPALFDVLDARLDAAELDESLTFRTAVGESGPGVTRRMVVCWIRELIESGERNKAVEMAEALANEDMQTIADMIGGDASDPTVIIDEPGSYGIVILQPPARALKWASCRPEGILRARSREHRASSTRRSGRARSPSGAGDDDPSDDLEAPAAACFGGGRSVGTAA